MYNAGKFFFMVNSCNDKINRYKFQLSCKILNKVKLFSAFLCLIVHFSGFCKEET